MQTDKRFKELAGFIDDFQVQVISYKFLWFTFYSRHKLRVYPGYLIDNNGDKVVLENEMIRKIKRPLKNTWYHAYLSCKKGIVIDVLFDKNLCKNSDFFFCKRIMSVLINKRRRIQPFVQCGEWFTSPNFKKIPIQKSLTVPPSVKVTYNYFK